MSIIVSTAYLRNCSSTVTSFTVQWSSVSSSARFSFDMIHPNFLNVEPMSCLRAASVTRPNFILMPYRPYGPLLFICS